MAVPQLDQNRYKSLKLFAPQASSTQPSPNAASAPAPGPKNHLHFGHHQHHKARDYGAVQAAHKSTDLKNDLRTELNTTKGNPENTLKAVDKALAAAQKDPTLQKELVNVALATTTNADKGNLIASKPALMKDVSPEQKSLRGHDLSAMDPKKIPALVADKDVDLKNSTWPKDVTLERVDRNIEGVKAPGLITYGAKGTGSIQGDVSGGAINNSHSQLAMNNAQINAQSGSKIDNRFGLTDAAGNAMTMADASKRGPGGVQRAMASRHHSAKLPGMSGPSFG